MVWPNNRSITIDGSDHGTEILIPMDSREQADRLVHALQHLSELCAVQDVPDPF